MDTTSERVAKNQSAFRDANERIEGAADAMEGLDLIPLICECADRKCTELARLTREEYEHVRADSTRFFVVPGHEMTRVNGVEVARIVDRGERYSILEKVGEAGAIATELDPRTV